MLTVHARTTPRISVNKLGEYIVARPARGHRILHDQKYPPAFQVARYTDAQAAISDFLATGKNPDVLNKAVARLAVEPTGTTWEEQSHQLCIDAIASFSDFPDFAPLKRMNLFLGESDPPKLKIENVSISVRPDLVLRGLGRQGNKIIGAIKLYIGKTNPLTEQTGPFVATVLHQYVADVLSVEENADLQSCAVFDVFANTLYQAPRNFRRRRDEVAAACRQIVTLWPTI